MSATFPFHNSFARLPERFFTRTAPTPVREPRLIRLNVTLAEELGLGEDALRTVEALEVFAGSRVPENAEPIAMAYAGHQFGVFVPQLGDGRAILLGEVIDRAGGRRDIQLKGAGRTPFSRGGDGRAAVGPVLREYVVSEAMHRLGIPTTRSLAAVSTGESVFRDVALPGAVLTRVAASHIRVGTFQFFASRGDVQGVRLLADHIITRHYPHVASAERPYVTLFETVIAAQAELISQWMLVGFIHGVMNTDNMAVSGETIDYGPCAFMDSYDPNTVFSSIDRWGRYAWGNQPAIAEWNLARFAECLLPLMADDTASAVTAAQDALGTFIPQFEAAFGAGLVRKIGLHQPRDGDVDLARDLMRVMHDNGADFTLTFRRLCDAAVKPDLDCEVQPLFVEPSAYDAWAQRWRSRLEQESTSPDARRDAMRRVNPAFIPRNHRVEAVIRAAIEDDDFRAFETLLEVLDRPYDDQPEHADYQRPPAEHERVLQTFCGT
jgi:serine/tyrosine/threonine adenylyltransferase